jgi:hypothetical protein
MSDAHSNHISTSDLEAAANYVDGLIDRIRGARTAGVDLGVEELTLMILFSAAMSGTEEHAVIAQLSLMLTMCLQRLA